MHTKCRWPSELSKSQTFRVHKLTRAERWAKNSRRYWNKELHVAARQASFHFSDGEHARHVCTRNVADLQNSQSHRHFVCINWPGQKDGQRQLQLINMRWLPSFMQQARWSSLDHLAFCMKDGWPSTLKDSGIVMLAKDLQPSKAPSPMAVTDSLQSDACQRTATFKGSRPNSRHWGMVTLAEDFQSAKAKSRMAFTDWGIATFTELRLVVLLKDLQAQKAHIPMSVTDSGIVMLSKEMQS